MNHDNERIHKVYKSLDNPIRILFWRMDDFALVTGPILIGLIADLYFLIPVGFLIRFFILKWRKKNKYFRFSHWFYWNFPTGKIGSFKSFPHSYKRGYFR